MIEIQANLWDFVGGNDLICITTNGIVKSNGALVMGAGVAKEARDRFPGIDKRLGKRVNRYGNRVAILKEKDFDRDSYLWIASFPTKNDWRDPSSQELIYESAVRLKDIVNSFDVWDKVILPRPGCGHGGLDWERHVKPELEDVFDNRFVIVSK